MSFANMRERMISGATTDKGTRMVNEDSLLVSGKYGLYAVADGVGGQNAGEIASRTTLGELLAYFESQDELGTDKVQICAGVISVLESINKKVWKMANNVTEYNMMASTFVGVYFTDSLANIFNIGDSRAYLLRDGKLFQLTEDHTPVNDLVRSGKITKAEAISYPKDHAITRAIGGEETLNVDKYKMECMEGDIFILCSDGLYNELAEKEITDAFENGDDIQKICDELVKKAVSFESNDIKFTDMKNTFEDIKIHKRSDSGRDNCSIICVKYGDNK